MKTNHFVLVLFTASLAFVQSCNFPVPAGTGRQLAATQTAQALVPVTGGTGTPTTTILSVSTATKCRSGPGSAYDVVATLNPGSGFVVIGRYIAGNFWIIANPAGGTCWVASRNAIVAGNTARLPEYPAPPVPAATPAATATTASSGGLIPGAPSALSGSRTCGRGFNGKTPIWVEDVVLSWQPGNGQTGYRIYLDNVLVSAVTGNSTTASLQVTYSRGGGQPVSDTFGVEAYNLFGASVVSSVVVLRCP